MRKILAALFIFLLLPAMAYAAMEPPKLSARGAVLLDRATGRILFSKNAHEQLPMASTTKIMTAVMAIESGRLDEKVIVSEYASRMSGSSVNLEAGEEKTLEELLYALMLRSGNDAATAIAEHLGGAAEQFARMMTRRAQELGAAQTNFTNPHGLHSEMHYTTAYDLGLIAAHAMSLPKFREVAGTPQKIISWTGKPHGRILTNQNRLLSMYDGADGIKTGWTTPAGRCFAASAARDGWGLVAVVLNAPLMWEDAVALLDFGYRHYRRQTVVEEGRILKTAYVSRGVPERVSLLAAKTLSLPLKENEDELLRFEFEVREPLRAPLRAGESVGSLKVYFGVSLVAETELLAGEDVPRRGLVMLVRDFFRRLNPFGARTAALFPRFTAAGRPR